MSFWTQLAKLLPALERVSRSAAEALAHAINQRIEAPYSKHCFETDEQFEDGTLVRQVAYHCARCQRFDTRRRAFTNPPCPGGEPAP